ncbi:MAG: thermonuclease family protein [Acidimicrobiia bacterium]|nr:thermonuclease family protein [Acidimicrobiia bacterium]
MRPSAIVATTLLTAASCGNDAPVVAAPGVGAVELVVDGDTIDVIIDGTGERVRLLGIDTPETHVDDGPPECYGPEAAAFTTSLLPVGTTVRLERDIVGRDDYGRLLAYVYRADDGLLVNEELLRQGYAQPLTIEPNGILADRFVAAAVAAEAAGVGLWAACAG